MPKISVLLPVKNGEKYIKESISSILNQTYQDFEILLMNDVSTDNTLNIIKSFNDDRIKIHTNEGFIDNLNRGIDLASGEFIVRMDVDDIMRSDRLMSQLEIMDSYKNIIICSSHVKLISDEYDIDNLIISKNKMSGLIDDPLKLMVLGNIVYHPTVMIRKSFLISQDIKYQNYEYAEDYKLWFEIAKSGGEFYVIPKELLSYRLSEGQVSQQHGKKMLLQSNKIKQEIIEYLIEKNTFSTNCNLPVLYQNLISLVDDELMSFESMTTIYFNIFFHSK